MGASSPLFFFSLPMWKRIKERGMVLDRHLWGMIRPG
jgi:hypothetical protein